jgi:L-aspartate oxidase
VVARAVYREVASGRGAFLDCRPLGPKLAVHFPTVFAACRAAGIDPMHEPIPVAPAAHYHMGGILTDARGRSTVDGLWACGEVASTGAHGANRLASNSLLEAVVFGARVADDIASSLRPVIPKAAEPREAQAFAAAPLRAESEAAEQRLRLTMAAEVGVIRDAGSLRSALATIGALEQVTKADRRLTSMLTTAKLITAAALERKESRGAHFRSDYPTPDERLAKRSFLTLAQAEAIAREASETLEPARRRHAAFGRAALHA